MNALEHTISCTHNKRAGTAQIAIICLQSVLHGEVYKCVLHNYIVPVRSGASRQQIHFELFCDCICRRAQQSKLLLAKGGGVVQYCIVWHQDVSE